MYGKCVFLHRWICKTNVRNAMPECRGKFEIWQISVNAKSSNWVVKYHTLRSAVANLRWQNGKGGGGWFSLSSESWIPFQSNVSAFVIISLRWLILKLCDLGVGEPLKANENNQIHRHILGLFLTWGNLKGPTGSSSFFLFWLLHEAEKMRGSWRATRVPIKDFFHFQDVFVFQSSPLRKISSTSSFASENSSVMIMTLL